MGNKKFFRYDDPIMVAQRCAAPGVAASRLTFAREEELINQAYKDAGIRRPTQGGGPYVPGPNEGVTTCTVCFKAMDNENFPVKSANTSGHSTRCKLCTDRKRKQAIMTEAQQAVRVAYNLRCRQSYAQTRPTTGVIPRVKR